MSDSSEIRRKTCSLSLIQNDCEMLKAICMKYRDPIFYLGLLPYMALFCRSLQEYFGISLISPEVDSEIYDIRNGIKLYGDRFSRSKKRIVHTDETQNKEFQDKLRFSFMKRLNIHYNLGIYFDNDRHPVGNTQLVEYLLKMRGLSEAKKGEKAFILGNHLGCIVGEASNALSKIAVPPNIKIEKEIPKFFYSDQNTNVSKFFNPVYGKDINLFFLHILCSLGFVKYVLEPCVSMENPWIMRIKYIVTHYSFSGLNRLKGHIENNCLNGLEDIVSQIEAIVDKNENIFNTKFRNCMMHYDLSDNEQFVISDPNYDDSKALFGLVEECFDGQSYEEYYLRLSAISSRIEEFITVQFDFQKVTIKEL